MKKFNLKSLGCKQNQLEGQIIYNELVKFGYVATEDIRAADIYILNSCTVTSHSDSEVNYLLNHAKKINPEIKTVLTGCCAQTYKEHKDFNYQNIDLIIGNSEKMNIAQYIENSGLFVGDIFQNSVFENKFLLNPLSTRVSIKIQDGCNNRCSYCIIPYARGNSRSNTIDNIMRQIETCVKSGIKEIVLTGIHIGQWGLEFGQKLINLLYEIEKSEIARYRLGSLYPDEIDDELIEFLKNSKKFCPHFHLSLQSLCDKTLFNMNRSYSSKAALLTIEKLHKNFDLPYLGCDIIVGFPEESEEDFAETLRNLETAKLSSIHCFPYSKRENTKAYSMPQIQEKIKTKRAKEVAELSKRLHREFLEKNKNRHAQVLVQKLSEKSGKYSAITPNYIKIYLDIEKLCSQISLKQLNNFSMQEIKNGALRHSLIEVDLSEYDLM